MAKATFEYPHNWSKSRLLLILYSARKQWKRKWLSTKSLAVLAGLSLHSAECVVSRCHKFDYIKQRGYYPDYEYQIVYKGAHFVNDLIPDEVKDVLIPILAKLVRKYISLTY